MEKISLGICCMEEKLKCSIMKYFIEKLKEYSEIDIIEFDTNTIFKKQINEWPIVDSFLCFYSNGFPLDKAIAYYELRRPYLVNDLHAQSLLQDRKKVNEILQDNDIPCPNSCYIIRDPITNSIIPNSNSNNTKTALIQSDDFIEINGTRIYKPFIEKPFNSDDHNNYIYYPMSQGGGCRKLFRKIGNNSSDYFKEINTIRESGSYTYEEFFKIDNSKDVKVYSTKLFSYSELRKSPSVDGCVERNCMGKEKRTLTQLTDQEANISYKINKAFKQFVCGFDILRVGGKSFVCDVNGWSFVKGDHYKAFYDNASKLLFEKLIKHFKILSTNSSSSNSATSSSSSAITSSIIISQHQPSSTNTSPEQPAFDFSPSTSPTNNNHFLPSSSSPLFNNNHKHYHNINNNNNNNNNHLSNSPVTTPPLFDLISASAFDKHQDIQTTNNNNNNRIYSSPSQSSSSSNHDIIDFESIHSLGDTGSAT